MKGKAPTRYRPQKLHSTFMVDNLRPRRNRFILVFPPLFLSMSSSPFRSAWTVVECLFLRPIITALSIHLNLILVVSSPLLRTPALTMG